MRVILKTMVQTPSVKKWLEYRLHFREFYSEREVHFDYLIQFIDDFHVETGEMPTDRVFYAELTQSGEDLAVAYLKNILEDPAIEPIADLAEFVSYLRIQKTTLLEMDLMVGVSDFTKQFGELQKKDSKVVLSQIDLLIQDLSSIKNKAENRSTGSRGLIFGEAISEEMREVYEKNRKQNLDSDSFYYDLGLPGLEKVKFKKGDLVLFGGFVSQGKSIWLRYVTYRLMIEYGMNCAFYSFEMTFEAVRILFTILHANNKEIFPNTPYISTEDFKMGTLKDAELDFLLQVATKDLTTNESYGNLWLDEPGYDRFRLSDLKARLAEIETDTMPVEALILDYMTLMYPLDSDRGSPSVSDFNQMIKGNKALSLNHLDTQGNRSPLLLVTAAQISRGGYESCLKNSNHYDISALRQYVELETSSDVVFTTLLTDDNRPLNTLILQNLKNRDGEVVPDLVEIQCQFDKGYAMTKLEQRSGDELRNALRSISI